MNMESNDSPINPYAAPSTTDTFSDDESEEAYLEAFIGQNAEYYLAKYRRAQEGGPIGGFNFAAFLFNLMWMGYRKMYFVALLFGGILILESGFELIVCYAIGIAETSPAWDLALNITAGIMVGVFANRLYIWHARRQIAAVLQSGLTGGEAKRELERRGGVNLLGAIGLIVLFMIVATAANLFVAVLLYGFEIFDV